MVSSALTNCGFSDKLVNSSEYNGSKIYYEVTIADQELRFNVCEHCCAKIRSSPNRHYAIGIALNNPTVISPPYILHWDESCISNDKDISLSNLFNNSPIPKSVSDKLDNLLYIISQQPSFIGQPIFLSNFYNDDNFYKLYFKTQVEFFFFLKTLEEKGFISLHSSDNICKISYDGLIKLAELETNGAHSKKCFIAMSFDESTKTIREAIRNALLQTGFEPYIIDEKDIDSDKTINDEIIAGLRKSKFVVADFTMHKNGVYFEAGFAVGQGKQVIYTCKAEDFAKAHFDIKPLQHIIYKDEFELQSRLVAKIEAWIK
jgi:hypothetical protein